MSRIRPFCLMDMRWEKSPLRAAISASSRSWRAASLGAAPLADAAALAAAFLGFAPSRLARSAAGPLPRAERATVDAACEVARRAPVFAGVRVCLRRVDAFGNGPSRAFGNCRRRLESYGGFGKLLGLSVRKVNE